MVEHIWDTDPELHVRAGDARAQYQAERDWVTPPPEPPWPLLHPAALHGLAGDMVGAIAPHTEADPVAILGQYLVCVGNALGRSLYFAIEGDRHYCNMFALIAGSTSKARKGTSYGRVRQIMEVADSDWLHSRVVSGLSSGEGVIWAVRDPIIKHVKNEDTGQFEERTVDAGISDKRVLVVEAEFARPLQVIKRDGNTLSPVLRDSWDRGNLAILTKNNPAKATNAHISIIGHCTIDELQRSLDDVALTNGFANRFLFLLAQRSKELPFGGALDPRVTLDLAARTRETLDWGRQRGRITFSDGAAAAWENNYHELSAAKPGLLGDATARSEAQTLRLATLYAALDRSPVIAPAHLAAALAMWRYGAASCEYIFGDALGDDVADTILRALRQAPDGLTRTEISGLFGRHLPGPRLDRAFALLLKYRKAGQTKRTNGGGRPTIIWKAI